MTDQPKSTTQLSPEEWKQLCLLNCQQLQNFIGSIPPQIESGAPGLTADHLAMIDNHVVRARTFLNAWTRAKPVVSTAEQQAQVMAQVPAIDAAPASNGAAEPQKGKGGWPKGRKRNAPRADVGMQ